MLQEMIPSKGSHSFIIPLRRCLSLVGFLALFSALILYSPESQARHRSHPPRVHRVVERHIVRHYEPVIVHGYYNCGNIHHRHVFYDDYVECCEHHHHHHHGLLGVLEIIL